MIKLEAIKKFTLGRFGEISNLKRKDNIQYELNTIYIGDVFECDEDLARYLTGDNERKMVVVKILEVIPKETPTIENIDKSLEKIHQSSKKGKKSKTNKK